MGFVPNSRTPGHFELLVWVVIYALLAVALASLVWLRLAYIGS